MLAREDEVDVEVVKADQLRINEFGRLSMRKHELEDELKALKAERGESEMVDEAVLLAEEAPGAIKCARPLAPSPARPPAIRLLRTRDNVGDAAHRPPPAAGS